MSQQKEVRHRKVTAKKAAALADAGNSKVSSKQRKEDAKPTLYLNRI